MTAIDDWHVRVTAWAAAAASEHVLKENTDKVALFYC